MTQNDMVELFKAIPSHSKFTVTKLSHSFELQLKGKDGTPHSHISLSLFVTNEMVIGFPECVVEVVENMSKSWTELVDKLKLVDK